MVASILNVGGTLTWNTMSSIYYYVQGSLEPVIYQAAGLVMSASLSQPIAHLVFTLVRVSLLVV